MDSGWLMQARMLRWRLFAIVTILTALPTASLWLLPELILEPYPGTRSALTLLFLASAPAWFMSGLPEIRKWLSANHSYRRMKYKYKFRKLSETQKEFLLTMIQSGKHKVPNDLRLHELHWFRELQELKFLEYESISLAMPIAAWEVVEENLRKSETSASDTKFR